MLAPVRGLGPLEVVPELEQGLEAVSQDWVKRLQEAESEKGREEEKGMEMVLEKGLGMVLEKGLGMVLEKGVEEVLEKRVKTSEEEEPEKGLEKE